ncbi:MAG: TatD family hydrolase [Pseudomonadota bacterium]
MLFDSHVNLHGEAYEEDRAEVMARARDADVTRFIGICDKIENFAAIRDIARGEPNMWCSVGAHPHYAKDHLDLTAEQLIEACQDQIVCGVGETGLDFHYGYSPEDDQVRVFQAHIDAAREAKLPLIVHTREADDLTGDILEREMARGAFQPLLHCYTGGPRLAERARDLDAYFSVSGIVSFKRADDVRSVVMDMPLDRVILETDCPYLAPTPHRGRRNEPAYLVDVCRAFADLRGLDYEEAAKLTTDNCLRLFGRTH